MKPLSRISSISLRVCRITAADVDQYCNRCTDMPRFMHADRPCVVALRDGTRRPLGSWSADRPAPTEDRGSDQPKLVDM